MKKWDLPKGWEWKRLGDISTVQGGNGAPQDNKYFKNGIYNFIRTSDLGVVGRTSDLDNSRDKINDMTVMELGFRLVPKNSILIPKSGASTFLNHRALITKDSYISSHLAAIVPNCGIDPKFLFYWSITLDAKTITNDVNYPSLRLTDLEGVEIPVPPLETQQKIVAILDKAEEIKRLRAEANAQTQKMIQCVFLDMFGDPVQNLKRWSVSRIGDVTSKISSGSTPLGGREVYSKSGILFIRSQNVLMNRLNLDDVAYIDNATHANMKRTWVNHGDVLLNITGASIGRVAWYDGENGSANVNQHVCIIRPNHKIILPEVLAFQISMPSFQQKIMMRQSGATRQAFTFTQISDFKIILPDLALQNQFMSIMRAINGVGQKQKEQDSQLLINKNNLLSNAFKGELVA